MASEMEGIGSHHADLLVKGQAVIISLRPLTKGVERDIIQSSIISLTLS